ncbi:MULTISPECIES: DUF167 domain-containing protein [unclassified Neochlamydia]|uniref:DUF167 domain-containing protein n=1 Tax=unclassified Neochlamydia TaxID=2643326 RepID=UPI00140874FE|nr:MULTISPECIES: DUF167 domain-containing protein [unclassified Neochlamydia]MBS4166430.1 UPF0235 protein [Neochlamydia sp. AcF65]NGY95650.1 UPF0235 protein [Neochlamydia sp. AcF84]
MFKNNSSHIYLPIKVVLKAKKSEITGWENDRLRIRLSAIPEKGLANDELLRLLSITLGIPKTSLQIVQGKTARLKIVRIEGLSSQMLHHILMFK